MDTDFNESSITSTTMSNGTSALEAADTKARRVAQKAHQAVDKMEESFGTGAEKVMGWQQEYSEMAREQVVAKPLAAVGIAFAVGVVFSKLFMR